MLIEENNERRKINEYWVFAKQAVERQNLKESIKCLMIIKQLWIKLQKKETIQMFPEKK